MSSFCLSQMPSIPVSISSRDPLWTLDSLPHLSVRNVGLGYHMQPTLQNSLLMDSAVKTIRLVLLVNLLTAFILLWS